MALFWILLGIAYIVYATLKEGDPSCLGGILGFVIVIGVLYGFISIPMPKLLRAIILLAVAAGIILVVKYQDKLFGKRKNKKKEDNDEESKK